MQTPSLGQVVLVPADPKANNGASEAPATITRVWNDHMVNVRVLLRLGTAAGRIARGNGIEPVKVPNEVYGHVNQYPEEVLREAAGMVWA